MRAQNFCRFVVSCKRMIDVCVSLRRRGRPRKSEVIAIAEASEGGGTTRRTQRMLRCLFRYVIRNQNSHHHPAQKTKGKCDDLTFSRIL